MKACVMESTDISCNGDGEQSRCSFSGKEPGEASGREIMSPHWDPPQSELLEVGRERDASPRLELLPRNPHPTLLLQK